MAYTLEQFSGLTRRQRRIGKGDIGKIGHVSSIRGREPDCPPNIREGKAHDRVRPARSAHGCPATDLE